MVKRTWRSEPTTFFSISSFARLNGGHHRQVYPSSSGVPGFFLQRGKPAASDRLGHTGFSRSTGIRAFRATSACGTCALGGEQMAIPSKLP